MHGSLAMRSRSRPDPRLAAPDVMSTMRRGSSRRPLPSSTAQGTIERLEVASMTMGA